MTLFFSFVTSQISLTDGIYFPRYSVKCVSCFMLRDLMTSRNCISEILKFDFLENKKSLQSEIKNIFSGFKVLSFRLN